MSSGTPIELCAYSPQWPRQFAAELSALATIFPTPEFRIEHIGSTSVPGLPAKPIIDILLGACSLPMIEGRIPALEAMGYTYRPEFEVVLPRRRYFVKPAEPPRHVHLHAVERKGAFWRDHLLFRDALRALPDLAAEYAALKIELAARHRDNRSAYTDAKAPFIRSVIERARTHGAFGIEPLNGASRRMRSATLQDDALPHPTDRLVLRRFLARDLVPFQSYRGDPEVGRYQGWSAMDDAAAAAFIAQMAVAQIGVPGEWFQVAVADKSQDVLVGDIGIGIDRNRDGVAELGFSMAPAAQGRGLGAEAVGGALAILFDSGKIDVVEGITDARNIPSIRLLERVGMRLDRSQETLFKGEMCAEHVYRLTRSQWKYSSRTTTSKSRQ